MHTRSVWVGMLALLLLVGVAVEVRAQPTQVSYQGHLYKEGAPFDGTAQFKFVLVDGGTARWSHDGTSATGEQPDGALPLVVDQGLFSVLLGGAGMVPLQASAIAGLSSLNLRIWVDTGSGFEQLPDQPLASSPFALHAESAERSFVGFSAAGVIHSTSGGFQFPDGSVQTTAASGGGGGGTLDQAYDSGGPGGGRTIVADAGAVSIQGSDGLRVAGSIGVGTTAAPFARISVENVGGNDTTRLLSFDEAQGGEFHFESGFAGTGSTGNSLKLNSAWTNPVMTWRGDGNVGIGTNAPLARLQVLHAGAGVNNPAVSAVNIGADGTAISALSIGTGPTLAVTGTGSGDLAQFGKTAGSPASRFDSEGRLRLAANLGSGVAGAAVYTENTHTGGIALWGKVTSSDATCVFEQNGSGSLLRAFKSGSLKFEVQNSGRVVTTALQITGGGDLAEPFDVANEEDVLPGMVLVIDSEHPGRLKRATRAYDSRVAGVVSGANGIRSGITLTPGIHQVGGREVALTGRVYVLADASNHPIEPGDLLTTSSTVGHAMAVDDPARAAGAILGKAMSRLEGGRGYVLALVSLQ